MNSIKSNLALLSSSFRKSRGVEGYGEAKCVGPHPFNLSLLGHFIIISPTIVVLIVFYQGVSVGPFEIVMFQHAILRKTL